MDHLTTPQLADDFLLTLADAQNRGMTLQEARDYWRPELSSAAVRETYHFMSDRRWVDVNIAHGVLGPINRILPSGWDRIEHLQNPAPSSSGQVINIERLTNNGQFAVGNENTQVQNIGFTSDDLDQILRIIKEHRPPDEADNQEWDDIEVVVAENSSPAAVRTALRWFAQKLDDVSTRAVGTALGKAMSNPDAQELISGIFGSS